MATYTGRVIVSTLKEVYEDSNIATGNTKSNVSTDEDYIAPYTDETTCSVSSGVTCPTYFSDKSNTANYVIETQLPVAITEFQVLLNGTDITTLSDASLFTNNNYVLIQFSNTVYSDPTISITMKNTSLGIDLICPISY